jgi:hypothetical protein
LTFSQYSSASPRATAIVTLAGSGAVRKTPTPVWSRVRSVVFRSGEEAQPAGLFGRGAVAVKRGRAGQADPEYLEEA